MSAREFLWIALFCVMQCGVQFLFKWGSMSKERWVWGFVGGHVIGVSSVWFLMLLYRTMNPNLAFGVCYGGMFLLSQVMLAVVFRSGIGVGQYVGIGAITAGIVLLAMGKVEAG